MDTVLTALAFVAIMPIWVKVLLFLVVFVIIGLTWQRLRNTISTRTGMGRFYSNFRESDSDDHEQRIQRLRMLGDYLQYHQIEDSRADWEWRLGDDLKELSNLAENWVRHSRNWKTRVAFLKELGLNESEIERALYR